MRMGARARLVIGLVALAVLAGCSPETPAATPSPTVEPSQPSATPSALSLRTIATIPDVQVPGSLNVVAGTGTRFLMEGQSADDPARYTLDNGRNWQDAPAELSVRADLGDSWGLQLGNFVGYGGSFVGVRQEPEPDWSYSGFQVWDPATGQVTTLDYDLDPPPADDGDSEVWVSPIDYIGQLVLLNDSRVFDVAGTRAFPVEPRLPAGLSPDSLTLTGLTKDGQYAVGSARVGDIPQLVIAPLGAAGEPEAIESPGLLAVDVSATTIHYLLGDARKLEVCRAEVTAPLQASCARVATGDFRASRVSGRLGTSDGADQIFVSDRDGERQRLWFVRGSRPTLVSTSLETWLWLPYRDAAGPTAQLGSWDDRTQQVVTIADDSSTVPLFGPPDVAASPGDIAVAAARVVYQQEHLSESGTPTRYAWMRTITPDGLGDEVLLTDRVAYGLRVSGDRTAVQWDRAENARDHTVVFYDGLTETGRLAAGSTTWASTLSGPYARLVDEHSRIDRQVARIDGHTYQTGQVVALFGSLVVEASSPEATAGRGFAVRDLARPDAEPTPLKLPDAATRIYRNTGWLMWGEWLAIPYETFTGNLEILLNYRTGEVVERDGWPVALGDGWVVLTDYKDRFWLSELAGDREVPIGDGLSWVSTDGVRTIAWTSDQGAGVAVVEGLRATPPRLLGAVGADEFRAGGKRSWTPQLDLTKPVGAGTIEITDSTGAVVQRIPTDPASGGSIRGVTWDGRDAGGDPVPAGDYTWTLVVTASDGSGMATSVDGLRTASGIVTVTR